MDVGFISTCEISALHYWVRSFSVGTKYSDFFLQGYYRNVPDEGYYRNVPDEGYYRNVPD
jgi:hypothetical protein